MSRAITMDAYSPIGDLVCICFCWAMVILVACSYVRRTRSFGLFLSILGSLLLSAYSSILYRTLLNRWQPAYSVLIAVFRVVMHISLFTLLTLFMIYNAEIMCLPPKEKRRSTLIACAVLAVCSLYDLIGTASGTVFRIAPDGQVYTGPSVFSIGYLFFLLMNLSLMIYGRKRIYRRLMSGFFLMVAMSILLNLVQRVNGESSFTVVSFAFPVMGMLYFMHARPYDSQLGALDLNALDDFIRRAEQKHQPFGYISLYMPELQYGDNALPEDLQAVLMKASVGFFRNAKAFCVGKGHYILTYPLGKNADAPERLRKAMDFFDECYARLRYDYKIVIGQSEETAGFRDYVAFIRNIHFSMNINSVHLADAGDRDSYDEYTYILSELADIYSQDNPDDPRVLVYCQPVWDVSLNRFDTAEALMRLNLEKTGLVFPDKFIHVAEDNGYIHTLTEIILHKTCEGIWKLTQEGYSFSRISVNVAADELKDPAFCDDLLRIIGQSGVSCDRIALELTESENDSDFRIAQNRLGELKKQGIQFYLDDFGTGYSNMERIMQLPFDIIKFDRSLVIASGTDAKAAVIVRQMSQLFDELSYKVLYEGVETEADVARCKDMRASYLQGYKYSKPVPMEQLTGFFEKSPA